MTLSRSGLAVAASLAAGAVVGCGNQSGQGPEDPAPSEPSTAAAAPATPAPPRAKTVEIRDFEYDPRQLAVEVGTTVSWTNDDAANHTVTFDDGSERLGNQPKGETVRFEFAKSGTYAYHCDYHPNMHGTVVVG